MAGRAGLPGQACGARSRLVCPTVLERIVLHIGLHKTGTTSIQASLVDSYDALLGRGILYPRAGRAGVAHNWLAEELLITDTPISEVPSHVDIVEEALVARPEAIIISAEGLTVSPDGLPVTSRRPVEWARRLSEELQPHRIEVLAYVRPQWEYVESAYAELVKLGLTWEPFDRYVERTTADDGLDYLEKFRPWRQAFGDQLEVRPYGPDLLLGGDAVADFWDAVGLEPPAQPRRHENPRTGARTTEMLRLLRAFLADHQLDALLPPPAKPHLRPQPRAVMAALGRGRRRIEAALPDDRPFSPLTPEMVADLAARFGASNERFVRTHLGGRHESAFSPPKEFKEASTWSLSAASEDERLFFAQLVRETLAKLRTEPGEGAQAVPRPHPPAKSGSRRAARPMRRRLRRGRGRLQRLLNRFRRRPAFRSRLGWRRG